MTCAGNAGNARQEVATTAGHLSSVRFTRDSCSLMRCYSWEVLRVTVEGVEAWRANASSGQSEARQGDGSSEAGFREGWTRSF